METEKENCEEFSQILSICQAKQNGQKTPTSQTKGHCKM